MGMIASQGGPVNAWGINSGDIPGGIILGVSFVSTKEGAIRLAAISVSDNKLFVSFEQNSSVIATGETTNEHSVLVLNTRPPCLSGFVEVGAFHGSDIKINKAIKVQDDLVVIVPESTADKASVTVTQDNISESIKLTKDINLDVDPQFTVEYTEESKQLTLSLSEEVHRSLLSLVVEAVSPTSKVLTINNIQPNEQGEIYLDISLNGRAPNWLEVRNNKVANIRFDTPLCATADIIDSYISPDLSRSYIYMPLDDAYDPETGIRNTLERLAEYNKIDTI